MSIVKRIEKWMPERLLEAYRLAKRKVLYRKQRKMDAQTIMRLRQSDRPMNVVFFATLSSMWKYDSLYQVMVEDKNFNPTIVVCPFVSRGEDFMRKELNRTYELFHSRGWNVVMGYDADKDRAIDVHELKPDIIFYTESNTQHPDFAITRYRDCLTCYLPYGYNTIPYAWYCTSLFHNQLWKFFIECEENARLIEKLSPIPVDNHCVVGYPMYDVFVQKPKSDPWKKFGKLKRIIWAPHSSIGNNCSLVHFSTFLDYAETMLNFADTKKDEICVAFKPHPELKSNLYKHPDWGKEKTDAYYAEWEKRENTMIAEGDYVDLFLTSDALIHDCGSFLVEYLYTKKPCLFLTHEGRMAEINEIGMKAYDIHYHAILWKQIEQFIENVVIQGNDSMKATRDEFFKKVLMPRRGASVAENIQNVIKQELNRA